MDEGPLAEDSSLPTGQKVPWFRLFDTRDGMRRYILRAWLLELIPSLVVSGSLAAAGMMTKTPASDALIEMADAEMLLMVLAVAPIGETLLPSATLGILSFFLRSRMKLAAASTGIWELVHLPNGPLIPLVIAWPFFIFSIAYLAWRPAGLAEGDCGGQRNSLPAKPDSSGRVSDSVKLGNSSATNRS